MTKFLIFILCILGATKASAGWSSGGGELIQDATNPWFMQNTKAVRYCILIDEANFGASLSEVKALIPLAIQQWKDEFKNAIFNSSPIFPASVATQSFIEEDCQARTDLKFQFGHLTGEQIKNIGDPKKFIGITVRTDYDPVHLKGKGFMYFSPERGPLKIGNDNLVPDPWSCPHRPLLHWVLLHELGHIFGIGHESGRINLMGDTFAEKMLQKSPCDPNLKWYPPQIHYFKYSEDNNSSLTIASKSVFAPQQPVPNSTPQRFHGRLGGAYSTAKKFFGASEEDNCYSNELKGNQLRMYTCVSGGSKLLGTASLVRSEAFMTTVPAITLWLTDKQTVFPNLIVPSFWRKTVAYRLPYTDFKGTYVSEDKSVTRKIFLQVPPYGFIRIGGEMDGEVYIDIFNDF